MPVGVGVLGEMRKVTTQYSRPLILSIPYDTETLSPGLENVRQAGTLGHCCGSCSRSSGTALLSLSLVLENPRSHGRRVGVFRLLEKKAHNGLTFHFKDLDNSGRLSRSVHDLPGAGRLRNSTKRKRNSSLLVFFQFTLHWFGSYLLNDRITVTYNGENLLSKMTDMQMVEKWP